MADFTRVYISLLSLQILKVMVERCWHPDPEKRPSFTEVVSILDSQLQKVIRQQGRGGGGGGTGGQASSGGCCSVQ